MSLPNGQHLIDEFPRFGLLPYAGRFPSTPNQISLRVAGDVKFPKALDGALSDLDVHEQVSDFHCVTTWSYEKLKWSGYRFRDVFEEVVQLETQVDTNVRFAVFKGQDGYKNILPLADLLADDVMLATHLNGKPLSISHGAPLRLVTPAHYGYKNVKHLKQIDFLVNAKDNKTPWYAAFLTHPRGRVATEERSAALPNWLFRFIFQKFIKSTRQKFDQALQQYEQKQS